MSECKCKWLKISDVTREYGVSGPSVIYWIQHGFKGKKLKAIRPGGGGLYLIHVDDLKKFMEDADETADVKE